VRDRAHPGAEQGQHFFVAGRLPRAVELAKFDEDALTGVLGVIADALPGTNAAGAHHRLDERQHLLEKALDCLRITRLG
jgi:hypothetical protein